MMVMSSVDVMPRRRECYPLQRRGRIFLEIRISLPCCAAVEACRSSWGVKCNKSQMTKSWQVVQHDRFGKCDFDKLRWCSFLPLSFSRPFFHIYELVYSNENILENISDVNSWVDFKIWLDRSFMSNTSAFASGGLRDCHETNEKIRSVTILQKRKL